MSCHDAGVTDSNDELPPIEEVAETESESDERRRTDRRGGERRRFREESGRRSERPRRREDRRSPWTRLVVVLVVVGVLGLTWRAAVVAPRRGAQVEAEDVGRVAGPLLSEVSLPMQAVPGFGPPREGDPAARSSVAEPARAELEALSKRLTVASEAGPRVPDPWIWQGPVRLALGDERGARLAWEQVLALGSVEQGAPARVGIAVLQVRAGLRQPEEQDRNFALEAALHILQPVDQTHLVWPQRLVTEAVAHLALGNEDAADAVLAELANVPGDVAAGVLPGLRARRSGEEPVSSSLATLLDRPPDQE